MAAAGDDGPSEDELLAVMNLLGTYDTDGSGSISVAEARVALGDLGHSEEALDKVEELVTSSVEPGAAIDDISIKELVMLAMAFGEDYCAHA